MSTLLDVLRTITAIGLLLLSHYTETRGLAFFGLLVGANILAGVLLSRLGHIGLGPFCPPGYTHSKLAASVGMLVSVAVFLPTTTSRYWQVALLLLAIIAIVQGAKMVLLAFASTFARQGLRSAFRSGRSPRLRLAHVLVVGHGAVSARILSAWLLQLSETLWSTRQQDSDATMRIPAEEKLQQGWPGLIKGMRVGVGIVRDRWFSKRSLAAFLTLADVDRLRGTERDYVIQHAAGSLAVCTRGGLWRALLGVTPEEEENQLSQVKEVVRRSTLLRMLAAVGKEEDPTAQTDQRYHTILHHSIGPVALLVPEMAVQMVDSVDDDDRHRMHGYELVSAPVRSVSRATPQVIGLIANVALPLARSDRRLDQESQAMVPRLAAEGFAPLADSYLRFRLSGSAVERFLCLFDCFEVLIKYSVFALAVSDKGPLLRALERPSLGTWTSVLREHLKGNVALEGALAEAIGAFWQRPLAAAPRELIEAVNGAGLSWPDKIPRSHLGWLDWLVWLRNATKGHGGVEEKACLPIWHEFHAALLDAVGQLSPLALNSVIWSQDLRGTSVPLRGWLRGPFRSSTIDRDPVSLAPDNCRPELIYGDLHIGLGPFVLCSGNACLTWNSGDPQRAEFIDYATGRLVRRKLSETDGLSCQRQ